MSKYVEALFLFLLLTGCCPVSAYRTRRSEASEQQPSCIPCKTCTAQACLDWAVGPNGLAGSNATARTAVCLLQAWPGGNALPYDQRERAAKLLWQWMPSWVTEPDRLACAIAAFARLGNASSFMVDQLLSCRLMGPTVSIRDAAMDTLRTLSKTSPKAAEAVRSVDAAISRAFRFFNATLNGDVSQGSATTIEGSAAMRFQQSPVPFGTGSSMSQCLSCWPGQGSGGPVFPLKKGGSCAALCLAATPYVMSYAYSSDQATKQFLDLISKGAPEKLLNRSQFCTGFAELPTGCVLLSGGPPAPQRGESTVPVQVMRMPSAVTFCARMEANGEWTSRPGSGQPVELKNAGNWVQLCQQSLSQDFASATYRLLGSHEKVLPKVCEEECVELVEGMNRIVRQPNNDIQRVLYSVLKENINRNRNLDEAPELGLGEICTRNVVQLVEAKVTSCCALACGWDPISRRCAGLLDLSLKRQQAWWGQCCLPIVVIGASDRQRMCDSAVKDFSPSTDPRSLKTGLLPRSSTEGFESGEDLVLRASLLETFSDALAEPGESPCRLSCPVPDFLPDTLLQCSSKARNEWFATNTVLGCTPAMQTQRVASPHACSQLAAAQTDVAAATWRLDVATVPTGAFMGTCTLYGRSVCSRNLVIIKSKAKAKMNSTSELLWMVY